VVAVGVWAAADREGAPAPGPGSAEPPSPVVARIPIVGKPRQLVLDAGTLWVVAEPRLDRIDPSAHRVVASVPLGDPSADLGAVAVSKDAAWVPEERSELLWRVDRATNRVIGRVRLGQVLHGPAGVATLGDTVWVTCCALEYGPRPAGMLLRVDGRRNQVTARVPVREGPLAVVADPEAIWVGTARGSLLRVDPASARVVRGCRRRTPEAGSRRCRPRREPCGSPTRARARSGGSIWRPAATTWASPRRHPGTWPPGTTEPTW
jgi:hypothetical protein